jgi:hypothetical protein
MNVTFLFDGRRYRQVDGVAMGSPLGPLLADIFMSKLERTVLRQHIQDCQLYCRYVDDIFIIHPDSTNTSVMLDSFNNAHPAIQFTSEFEKLNCIPFLDVLLRRQPDGSLLRTVYRKSTWTGQYLHFHSAVPLKRKRNLIRCLTERARKICSVEHFDSQIQHIRDILRENGYPERFIEKNMQLKETNPLKLTAPKKVLFISLPYHSDRVSDFFTRRLTSATARTFLTASLNVNFNNRLVLVQRLKDKLPRLATSMSLSIPVLVFSWIYRPNFETTLPNST